MKLLKTKAERSRDRQRTRQRWEALNVSERREYNSQWRKRNPHVARELAGRHYERHRADIIWKNKLYYMLMRVREGVIARGGVPFDG
jgi:hypothetical protein